ncbi:MAG: hypothetical protein ABI835_14660, partial [Chloroflexota bacterium]
MKKYRFDQFAATRTYTGSIAYSPDGKQIAHVNNATGQFNLWTIPTGGGMPRQLTSFTDNTLRGYAWKPDGSEIIFIADQNGDEQHQIYTIGAEGGWPEALTNKLDSQHVIPGVPYSPDMKTLLYAANDLKPENMEIILRDLETGELTRPFPSDEISAYPAGWSQDGRYATGVKVVSNTKQDILLYDTQTGEAVNLTDQGQEVNYNPGPWAKDGSGFYITTNEGREFTGLGFYQLADRKWEWVETPEHDIENVVLSKDGHILVWIVNEDGASRLYGRDLQTGAALPLPNLPTGVVD